VKEGVGFGNKDCMEKKPIPTTHPERHPSCFSAYGLEPLGAIVKRLMERENARFIKKRREQEERRKEG